MREQIENKVKELLAERGQLHDSILNAARHLESLAGERAFYQRQAASEKITEAEFDKRWMKPRIKSIIGKLNWTD